jgi:hypothetical protein
MSIHNLFKPKQFKFHISGDLEFQIGKDALYANEQEERRNKRIEALIEKILSQEEAIKNYHIRLVTLEVENNMDNKGIIFTLKSNLKDACKNLQMTIISLLNDKQDPSQFIENATLEIMLETFNERLSFVKKLPKGSLDQRFKTSSEMKAVAELELIKENIATLKKLLPSKSIFEKALSSVRGLIKK